MTNTTTEVIKKTRLKLFGHVARDPWRNTFANYHKRTQSIRPRGLATVQLVGESEGQERTKQLN